MIIEQPEQKFTLPPEGEQIAELSAYEDLGETENKFNPGTMTHRVQLVWTLKTGQKQYQWVTASMHSMSKLYEVAQALLQDRPPKALDLDRLVNKKAVVTIQHYDTEEGKRRSKIVDIRPLRYRDREMPKPAEPSNGNQEDVPF